MPRPSLASIFGVQDNRPSLGSIFGEDEEETLAERLARKRREMEEISRTGDINRGEEDPYAETSSVGVAARQILPRIKENLISQVEAPSLSGIATLPLGPLLGPPAARALDRVLPESLRGGTPESLEELRRSAAEDVERAKEEMRESMAARSAPPLATAATELGFGAEAMMLDPVNLIGSGAGMRAGRAGREMAEAVAPRIARAAEFDDLARASLSIGASPQAARVPVKIVDTGSEGAIRRLAALDETGNPVGSMTYSAEPAGGFRVMDIETGVHGSGAGRAMMRHARADAGGPYMGSFAETAEGEGFLNRLRETDPDIFPPSAQIPFLPPGSPRAVGPTMQMPGFQTNLFAQVDEPEVRDYIIQKSDEIAASIGSPQSWDEVEELAMRLGTDKESFLKRSPRFALMSKEERARLTMVIKGNEEDITGLQAKLAAGEASPEEQARLLRQIGERGSLIKLAVGVGSEYGRALNSLKMEARAALGQDALARQTLYKHYRQAIDNDAGLLDALARLDPSRPDELQAFLRNFDKPKIREYVQEYWIASILSGPPTHERNLIGNTFNAVAENLMVRPVRAVLDPVVAAAQGREREHFLRETPAAATGLVLGVRKGLARGFEILRRGYDTETAGKLLPVRSAFARSQNRVVREVVGPVATGSLRLLAGADALFKTMNHTAEIYAQAANAAAREGLSGPAFSTRMAELVANPTEQMVKAADDFALKATFNDKASKFGQAFINLRESAPHVGGFIAPFVKISDRLMVRGFEYTPVGFIKAARAPKGSAAVSDLAARGAIGSAVMFGAATLAVEGRLTGTAPSDPAEKAAFYAAGKQPWSAKIGDQWIPFGQLQPLATPLALVAAAHEGWIRNQEAPNSDKLAAAATQIGQYVTDQSYMDSVGKFFDAISGGESATRAASDLATQTAAGFMPFSGLMRSISQAIDPRLIDARTFGEKIRAQIPGQSLGMLAKLDPWGEEIVPEGGAWRGFLAKGTVLTPSRERQNPLDAELGRLGIPLGPVGTSLFDPVAKKSSKLTREDHYFYQQTAGRKTKELLTGLFADPEYQAADAEQQRIVAERLIGIARQYAKMMLMAKRHNWKVQ